MRRNTHLESLGYIESRIRQYTKDAAQIARGVPFIELRCYLDGIHSIEALADAIVALGQAYIEKAKAIRAAAPVVRGDTISVFQPQQDTPANAPSVEDERFLSDCRRHYLEKGFLLAADADVYEEIARKYPRHVHPARMRGSEAKRWRDTRLNDPVAKKAKPKWRR